MFGKTLLCALTIQISAFAGAITYDYAGNPFNLCQAGDCSHLTEVTVSLTLAAPLAPSTEYIWGANFGQTGVALTPLAFTMFNGEDSVNPLVSDPTGAYGSFIVIWTDSLGGIGTWVMEAIDGDSTTGPLPTTAIETGNSLTGLIYDLDSTSRQVPFQFAQYIGHIDGQPGSWSSVEASVPEPSAMGLVLLGGFCLLARRPRLVRSSTAVSVWRCNSGC